MEKNEEKKTTDKSVALLALRGPWVTSFWTSFLYFLTPRVWPEPVPVLSFSTGSGFVAGSLRCSGLVSGTSSGSTSSSEISWRRKTFVKIQDNKRLQTKLLLLLQRTEPMEPKTERCSTWSSAEQSSSPRHYCLSIFCRVALCLYPGNFCSADDTTNSPSTRCPATIFSAWRTQ